MRQKVLGLVLLIFGIYLLLVNPIVSFLIHVVFNVQIPLSFPYFNTWILTLPYFWWWITILVAGADVVLIKYGRRNLLAVQA